MELLINVNTDVVYIKDKCESFSFVYYPEGGVIAFDGDKSKRDCCERIALTVIGLIEDCGNETV